MNPYDLYLSSGCRTFPYLSDLAVSATVLLDLDLNKLIESEQFIPGFLGLELPTNIAACFLERLKEAGGGGTIVPSAYRQPRVSIEMAYPIALQAIIQKQNTPFPPDAFEVVKFWEEGAMWWEFKGISEELIKQGYIPGCACIRVDKLDGHIWTWEEEQSRIYGEEYNLEMATYLEPIEILHFLSEQLGFKWKRDDKKENQTYLEGSALIISAFKQSWPQVIEKMYGFHSTVHVQFKINPYKTGCDSAASLVLRAVFLLLHYASEDAVLLFNAYYPLIILQRISGQLTLNAGGYSWTDYDFAEVSLPYKMERLSSKRDQ